MYENYTVKAVRGMDLALTTAEVFRVPTPGTFPGSAAPSRAAVPSQVENPNRRVPYDRVAA